MYNNVSPSLYAWIDSLHNTSYYRDDELMEVYTDDEAYQLIEFLKQNQQHPVFERGSYSKTELNDTIRALFIL